MLGCWASSGDLTSGRECREAMLRLQECMRKPVRFPGSRGRRGRAEADDSCYVTPQMPKGKPRVSSINYHLARANMSR